MIKRMFIMLGFVVLLIAALAFGFYLHIQKLIASQPKPQAQTVTAITAATAEWQPQVSAIGTLNPVRGVNVTTEIAGLVRSVNFKSGQNVKAGELLVQLNADSDIATLHQLQAAAELAVTVLARDRQQLAAQAISQAQVDSDAADLKGKRAAVAGQEATIAKKTIRAPFAGRLGITTVNPGQYLNPGDKIVTLQTLNPIYVDFNLPQKQVSGLSVGQTVDVSSDAYAGQNFKGKVSSINPQIDTSTRNVQAEATVANDKNALLPGMFTEVKIDTGPKQSNLTLPQTAITFNPYGATVFLIKDGDSKDAQGKAQRVAQQVFVTTGATRGDQIAVLTGIKAGDEIVTSGQLKLKNGTPVVVNNAVVPSNDAHPTPQEQ